ncbi:MAG: acyl carrier protein [Alphaproteobacteria bacterium]
MTYMEKEIIDIIADRARIDRVNVGRDTTLDDLGIESLELIEIFFELEDRFDIALPLNVDEPRAGNDPPTTVGSVVETVEQLAVQRHA